MAQSPNNEQIENRFQGMSAEKKLLLSLQLYQNAWELKKAALKNQHPEWEDQILIQTLRQIFLHART